jgi:TDG/mug DNA glycosylase family protein
LDNIHDEGKLMQIEGFLPVVSSGAKALILGTFPGKESLRQKEYYAHPQNLFWDMMDSICGAGRDKDYDERLTLLTKAGVALWDVLKSCCRAGSVDSHIRNGHFTVNDFHTFLSRYPVKAMFFNGKKAEKLFQRHVGAALPFSYPLPSTSSANTRMTKGEKNSQWCRVKQYL